VETNADYEINDIAELLRVIEEENSRRRPGRA